MRKTKRSHLRVAVSVAALLSAAAVICVFSGCQKPSPDKTSTTPDTSETISVIADGQTTEAPDTSASEAEIPETESVAQATSDALSVTETGKGSNYINFSGSRVNIRAEHNKDSQILGKVDTLAQLIVTVIYTDIGAQESLRQWGKTTVNGVTGWVALYYLTPMHIAETTNDAAALNRLWQQLEGYWNTGDKKQASEFVFDGGKPYFSFFYWYSEADFSAEVLAPFSGDVNGIVRMDTKMHIFSMEEEPEICDGFLYLDLSKANAGLVRVNYGNEDGWIDCYYAGATADDAIPPLNN